MKAGSCGVAMHRQQCGVTVIAVVLGVLLSAATNLWLHWAELFLGARGHTALAGTAIPVGAFNVLFLLVVVTILFTRCLRPLAFPSAELLVVYVMMTVSTVISSSGGLHFIVPTITAAHYYANDSNRWAALFHGNIRGWIAQKDPSALEGFYLGASRVPWDRWVAQIGMWSLFMALVALATLCVVAILRRQWIDCERLAFPTVAVRLELLQNGVGLPTNRLLWVGFALPFAIDILNTVRLSVPAVPYVPTRTADQPDQLTYLGTPPWNAIGATPISFYRFVIGITPMPSLDVVFSCWLFWTVTKPEAVRGLAAGLTGGAGRRWSERLAVPGASGRRRVHRPYPGQSVDGAGLSQRRLAPGVRHGPARNARPDTNEPMSYGAALLGLMACMAGMMAWCVAAGMRPAVAGVLLLVAFTHLVAAARIRAETGNAWLFGPDIDTYKLMATTIGS